MADSAILVVDMIPGCVNEDRVRDPRYLRVRDQVELRRQINAVAQLISFASEAQLPVFLAEYPPYGATIPEIASRAVNPQIIVKRDGSAFYGTSLCTDLQSLCARKLILAGINTSACVYDTAQSAKRMGLEVVTSADLLSDFEWADLTSFKPFKNNRLGYFQKETTFLEDYAAVVSMLKH